jgi:rubrerythrin
MEVDLNQLPIPAWGLNCPKCRYLLDGLPAHRCPECGTAFNVADLTGTWTHLRPPRFSGAELPIPDFGFTCRGCQQPVAGWTSRTCPTCSAVFDPAAERPDGAWFHADEEFCAPLLPPLVEMLAAANQIPYVLSEERSVAALYMGRLGPPRLMISTAFFFELLHLIREESLRMAAGATVAPQEWTCPGCGESVPGNFDVCWSCQAARPAQG